MDDKMLTPTEAAALLGIKPCTVRAWIKGGKVRATKIGGRWRVAEDDLKRQVVVVEAK